MRVTPGSAGTGVSADAIPVARASADAGMVAMRCRWQVQERK